MRTASLALSLALAGCTGDTPSVDSGGMEMERELSLDEPEALYEPALHGLAGSAVFDGARLQIELGDRPVRIGIDRLGRGENLIPTEPIAAPSDADSTTLRIRRTGVVERWDAVPEGFEHSFVVEQAPSGAGALRVRVTVAGAVPFPDPVDPDLVHLDAPGTADDATYSGLHAWDADGVVLPSRFVVVGDAIVLEVDDTGARYPITIDPLYAAEARWRYAGTQARGSLGRSVAVGDFNDDGYDDVAVAEPCYGHSTDTACPAFHTDAIGRVYAFFGSADGFPTTPSWSTSPGGQPRQLLGISLAALDADGDGHDDLAAGAMFFTEGQVDEGAVFLFRGTNLGLEEPVWGVVQSNIEGARFGEFIANAGDIDGDGREELLVGSRYDARATLHRGTAYGLQNAPTWAVTSSSGNSFGYNGAPLDDDCDGDLDLVISEADYDRPGMPSGSPDNAGRLLVYRNTGGVLATTPALTLVGTVTGGAVRVGAVANVNGDTFGGNACDDLIMLDAKGSASVFLGHPTQGLAITPATTFTITGRGSAIDDGVVQSVGATVGAVDGDAYDDVLLRGRDTWLLFRGAAGGINTTPVWSLDFKGEPSVSPPGDFDADGVIDVVLGDPRFDVTTLGGSAIDHGEVRWVSFGEDADGDGSPSPIDCRDFDASSKPGAPERCDGVDNDCDGAIDEGLPKVVQYPDDDADGFGARDREGALRCVPIASYVSGFVPNNEDCDDARALVNPDAAEVCNHRDDDCDFLADEGVSTPFYRDADGDAFGTDTDTETACAGDPPPTGYVAVDGDCDDAEAAVRPTATETCNRRDDNCDGDIDEGVQILYFRDGDTDGFGDPSEATGICSGDAAPDGHVSNDQDCDDGNPEIRPTATEVCDPIDADENCNGLADDLDTLTPATGRTPFYADTDGDGQGRSSTTALRCDPAEGWSETSTDCDDAQASVYLGAAELPGTGIDESCDGIELCFRDFDKDGYRTSETFASTSDTTCATTDGEALAGAPLDCDDTAASAMPGAAEIPYDGIDQDCVNGDADDLDGDGERYTGAGGSDCNDQNADIGATQAEAAIANGVDDDCDGRVDEGTESYDDDGDGLTEDGGDCDDRSPAVPSIERCNGFDDDCDGTVDEGTTCSDDDADGFTEDEGDCNDADPTVRSGAEELRNGFDDDCDGFIDENAVDADGDGVSAEAGDCDDADPLRFPGAPEVEDSVDQDCDGTVDEGTDAFDDDGDGVTEAAGDCDDRNRWMAPGVPEVADLLDNDCNGVIDDLPESDDVGAGPAPAGGCNQGGTAIPPLSGLAFTLLTLRRRSATAAPARATARTTSEMP